MVYAKMNNKAEIVVIQTSPDQFNRVVSTKIFRDMDTFKESPEWTAFEAGPSKMINTIEEMEKMMEAHTKKKIKEALRNATEPTSDPMMHDAPDVGTGYQA